MSQNNSFDIIIAGAGASGLSLLGVLLASARLRSSRILLADRRLAPADDKTWCFWSDYKSPYNQIISHTWHTLQVNFPGFTCREKLKKYKYHCVRSSELSSAVLEQARKAGNITLLESEISGFSGKGSEAIMQTPDGEYTASRIFQSVLLPPGFENAKNDISLKQHFTGWEIETDRQLFDANRATFMDFDIPGEDEIAFFYVLPFSQKKALIEYTLFSDHLLPEAAYEKKIETYLAQKYALKPNEFSITRKEKGVIPMEDRHYPGMYCKRVWNTGTVGGLTKPSTGYTFNRIQRHSRDIVTALEQGKEPPENSRSSYRFRVYDLMFLYLMKHHPETAVLIFEDLFKRNSFDTLLQFLDEDTHFGQELRIFRTVPPLPFIKSIYKMKHRIFTGA
ncbi:MAG: lycopene cyclase family protein [Balneolaceae bacterium]